MSTFNSLMTFDENQNTNVVLGDQVTRAVIVKFNEVSDSTTLIAVGVKGERTIQVDDPTGFTAGKYVLLFNATGGECLFMTANILSILVDVVTIDTPLDCDYPIGTSIESAITNMNVDGSLTPRVFGLRGASEAQPVPLTFDCTRIIFQCVTVDPVRLNLFGDLPALLRGLVLRRRDGTVTNIFNVKSNGEIAGIMFDWIAVAALNPSQGVDGFYSRLTFAGQNKIGVAIRLAPEEDLEILVQDDLEGITLLEVVAEGHVVD